MWEAFIQPVVSKTKAGQSLWIFPEFEVGRPVSRTEKHLVGMAMFEESPETETVHRALPMNATGASA